MPTAFKDFERMFLEYYCPLDDANIAHNKLRKLKQCSVIQDYTTAFNNIIVLLPELLEVD